jgi:hypothetical protein
VKVTIHQPDLLPYSGFWFKMATSERFVLAVHDQFQKHGYQRRVQMRGAWCSHRLVGKPALVPLTSVRLQPGWQDHLADVVTGRYQGSRHWTDRGVPLVGRIRGLPGDSLVEANVAMIEEVRDQLGLTTELVVTEPPTQRSVDRLIEQVLAVGGTEYLAGQGGRAYMGEDAEERFAAAGITLSWSAHQHTTGDSIVSVLMDDDDPMENVLRAG